MGAAPALPVPPGLATCRALLGYDDTVRAAVTGLKNRDERGRVSRLADGLAALVPVEAGLVVTWAPTAATRRRARGFDQAELLARAIARRRRLPVKSLLIRRPGVAQAARSAQERWQHPGFAPRAAAPRAVLLIDDVATTGATLSAAAAALREAGAEVVHGLVVARAPVRAARRGEV